MEPAFDEKSGQLTCVGLEETTFPGQRSPAFPHQRVQRTPFPRFPLELTTSLRPPAALAQQHSEATRLDVTYASLSDFSSIALFASLESRSSRSAALPPARLTTVGCRRSDRRSVRRGGRRQLSRDADADDALAQ